MATTVKRPMPVEFGRHASPDGPTTRTKSRRLSTTSEARPKTIDGLITSRANEDGSKNVPIIAYPYNGSEYTTFTPVQVNDLANKAASFYSRTILTRRISSSEPVQVVALLGASDFDYFITALAVSKLGHTALFLSIRISQEAHLSLLNATKATVILTDQNFQTMGRKVTADTSDVKLGTIARLADFASESSEQPSSTLDAEQETSKVAWIIHSSGSTSLPKPVFITHSAALRNYTSDVRLVGFITLPLFHAHGLSVVFRCITNRKQIYMYNASLPLTAKHLIRTLKDHPDIQALYGVPYAMKLLAEDVEGTRLLAGLDMVMSGGSPCPKPIGDKLVRAGVMLVSHFGTTETGQLMTTYRQRNDLDWDFFRPSEALKPYLQWDEYAPGIVELVVKPGWPSKVVSNREDGSYATKDLFEKHPAKDAYRYYARKDDTINLVNGEKANPLLLEGVARENALVAEAVVFGQQKTQLGMFVVPARSDLSQEAIQDAVYPAIEQANSVMPAHGRLHKDMIRVLPHDTEYRKTDKGTVIRAAFYRQFASLVDSIYEETVPRGTLVLSESGLRDHLRKILEDVVDANRLSLLEDTTDLFSLGVDSLQASRIRSAILKDIDTGDENLTQNIVFDFPSIQAMAAELLRMRTREPAGAKQAVQERMQALIDKYTRFEAHVPAGQETTDEYVLLTGATGSLGAHIVAQLAKRPDVKKIYCLVRADSVKQADERLRASLTERHVDAVLEMGQQKIMALPSQLSSPNLGLSSQLYEDIASNLTSVIHAAWSVNFNLSLDSFETDCIAGTKHLIDLCLRARRPHPAKFNFCSSVSVVQGAPVAEAVEELPPNLNWAQNMGYAQSKLVTENIVSRAQVLVGVPMTVLRIGQIVGDTQHGVWNAQEAIPMTFQCARTIGCLPALDENVSWLPVDIVAAGVIDLSVRSAEQVQHSGVYHVVNHNTCHWTKDLLAMLKTAGLDFEIVDQREWLRRLRARSDPVANPPFKLAEFFASKYDRDTPRRGVKCLNDRARTDSQAMGHAPVVDLTMVKAFVGYLANVWASQSA